MGEEFLPGHAAWATLLLWVSSQIGAFIAHQLYLPRVIGMLCAGLLMRHARGRARRSSAAALPLPCRLLHHEAGLYDALPPPAASTQHGRSLRCCPDGLSPRRSIRRRNIPWAAVDAFPPKWGVQMRAAALATIFLRCG